MKRIAVFASGGGSNALKIMKHFQNHDFACVVVVFSNRQGAGVHDKAQDFGIPSFTITRESFYESEQVVKQLEDFKVDWVILAGFLWLVPASLISSFKNRIVNIHPALLPKFGGKGMYGMNVHRAVRESGEKESGMTIHLVNDRYDEGQIVLQARCKILPNDTPHQIASKVLTLEHFYYPRTIEYLLIQDSKIGGD